LQEEKSKKEKEISEKDNIIGDKEKQIYQYKKKTQELEKFKFVLDYKIKELKADIAPRDAETARLKQLTNEMDINLKHFNKVNANLGIIVDDLRDKQEKMQKQIKDNRTKIRKNDILIKSFKDDVYESVQNIDYFLELQKHTNKMFEKYVNDKKLKQVDINPEIQKEYENQRKYLENSKHSLEQKLKKDKHSSQKHMKENYDLIEQINELRRKRDKLQQKASKAGNKAGSVANSETGMSARKLDSEHSRDNSMNADHWFDEQMAIKRDQIAELRQKLKEQQQLQAQINAS
jgi:septal ring factor EnvC (AmiA/AmiB activator)